MKIILSTNDSETYLQFCPLVAGAWEKFVPNAEVVILCIGAEVANRLEGIGHRLVKYDRHPGMPSGHQAKLSRMLYASTLGDEFSMLADVDMLPLSGEFFKYLQIRKEGHILNLGVDAYEDWTTHRYPMYYNIGTGNTWKQILNPRGMDTAALLDSWQGPKIDGKDDPFIAPFSDESLLRALMIKAKFKNVFGIRRGWSGGIASFRLDRACWPSGAIPPGKFIDAHLPRPLAAYTQDLETLAEAVGLDPGLVGVGVGL